MTELLALFTQAAKLVREATDEAMSRHGVRVGQHIVLSVLWEEDGLTPGEIARRLEVATPTIVNTATRMEEANLLVRRPDPDDARLVRLYLTPHARSVRDEVRAARAGIERRATATLDPDELDHLRSALEKMIAQFRTDPAGGLCLGLRAFYDRGVSDPFAATYGPWALVAGGSEGLGAAFAHELARRGLDLVLVARRPGPLAQTAQLINQATRVRVDTVTADLAAPGAIDLVAEAVADRPVGLVVANAAISPTGPFTDASAMDISAVADLNCRASALLAHRFLPPMVQRGRGGLILMSSLAGLQGVPGLAMYSASKAFLITLGEALWAENRAHGVDVIACCAGAVTTPGYQQAARRAAPGATTPEHVATVALDALGHGFRVVPGPLNKVSTVALERLLPKRAAINIFGRASAATLHDPAS